jgi:hypothetical protein
MINVLIVIIATVMVLGTIVFYFCYEEVIDRFLNKKLLKFIDKLHGKK